jgi:tetratricopeptide (TPR) repeat protein
MLREHGDFDESAKLLKEALAMEQRLVGDRHAQTALYLNNLAQVLQLKGDLAGAESTFRQALGIQRALLGDTHPDVANTLNNLAFVLSDEGDIRGALQAEGQSLDIYRKLFPGDNPDVARTLNKLGYWYTETRDYASAERYLGEALAMRRRLFGQSHPDIASSLVNVAILQVATHHDPEALVAAHTAAEIFTATVSATSWKTGVAESVGGAALTGMGNYAAAERQLLDGYTILNNDRGALPMYRSLARRYLEALYRSWGRPGDARRYAAVVVPVSSSSSHHEN